MTEEWHFRILFLLLKKSQLKPQQTYRRHLDSDQHAEAVLNSPVVRCSFGILPLHHLGTNGLLIRRWNLLMHLSPDTSLLTSQN